MLVYVRGAGDIATGVAARLVRAGVSVVMADASAMPGAQEIEIDDLKVGLSVEKA